MTTSRAIVVALMVLNGTPASAMDFSFALYGDARLVVPPGDDSYLDGGLGKLHFGSDDGSPNVHFVEAIGEARLQLTPEIVVTATGRVDPNYGSAADLLEAWVRYRPVSTSEWSWSVKTGAFFPPFSLENDEIGWTDFWTLTPSAINSWVASELRILGAEGTVQWRRNSGTVSLIGAVFGWNENAGTLISERGFTLDDRATGLFEKVRIPDATATLFGAAPPLQTHLFTQIDSNPGWYIDLSWEPEDIGGFEVMRYDNDANPAADRAGDYAWHTSFWDFGFESQLGAFTVLAQALDGSTVVGPSDYALRTNFRSAYGLVGLDLDQWWLAGRIEWFQTRSAFAGPSALLSEDGHAGTLSASWQPKKWLRLTSEVLVSDSTRPERVLTGEAARQIETQLQLALRVYY